MPHNPRRLHEELIAAIPELEPVVGDSGIPEANLLLSSAGTSLTLTVPDSVTPAELDPVLAAHDPTPDPPPVTDYVGTTQVDAKVRTTDGTFHEVWRLGTAPKHTYRAILEMRATDATDQTTKGQQAVLMFKGLVGSVAQVGPTTVLWSAPDVGTTAWAIQAQVQGTDLVFGVRGAAGKTLDWSLAGEIVIFAPEGLEP
jgi:hypothetical protein